MNIHYDKKQDALYIDLAKGEYKNSKKVTDSIVVDMSQDGKVIGIEILDASDTIQLFDPSQFHQA